MLKWITSIVLIAVWLAACTVPTTPLPIPTTPVVPIVPATVIPTASPRPIDTAVPTASATSTPTAVPPIVIDNTWPTYTNAKYGFSFRYPSDWNLKEIVDPINTMSGHAVHVIQSSNPPVTLVVAFKHADEANQISPTGIGSGELISRGAISFLGQDIERVVLVDLGKDLAVYYDHSGLPTQRGNLVF